jgi:hypothetical protein
MTQAIWSETDLSQIDGHDEVRVASRRPDGTLSSSRVIWAVRLEDEVYVRSVNGAGSAWYRSTRHRHQGQLHVGSLTKDVAMIDVDHGDEIEDRIDAAYRAKYARYPGPVVAAGGAGVVISSMAGHRQPAFEPAHELLALPFLTGEAIPNPVRAYEFSKRANQIRVQAEAVAWGERGARVNSISPGVILTPLAQTELDSARGAAFYLRQAPCTHVSGTPDLMSFARTAVLIPVSYVTVPPAAPWPYLR